MRPRVLIGLLVGQELGAPAAVGLDPDGVAGRVFVGVAALDGAEGQLADQLAGSGPDGFRGEDVDAAGGAKGAAAAIVEGQALYGVADVGDGLFGLALGADEGLVGAPVGFGLRGGAGEAEQRHDAKTKRDADLINGHDDRVPLLAMIVLVACAARVVKRQRAPRRGRSAAMPAARKKRPKKAMPASASQKPSGFSAWATWMWMPRALTSMRSVAMP